LRKLLIPLFFVIPVCLSLPGCGYSSSNGSARTSGIHYRAFLSNSVSSGTSSAGLSIVDAQNDLHPNGLPSIPAGNTPGMMRVTPNRAQTLVFSGNNTQSSDNQFSIINNLSEADAANITLPGYTESFVVSPDSSTAYVAVPTASVVGQSPGVIKVINVISGAFTGEVDIPSVHYVSIGNSGNRILAFSTVLSSLAPPCTDPTPSFVFVVTPSEVGVQPCPVVPVPGFDHPVQAYFSSDDSTAYIVNCGAECGGTMASVQMLNLTTTPPTPGTAFSVPAATEALVDGSTMYLAGTPYANGVPSQPCTGQTTAATTCGLLTIFDLNTMTVTNPANIVITDGYHNRIALGASGQLFIGARTCTEIIPPQPPPQGAEIRGCLSIYNPTLLAAGGVGTVIMPPANGDATGIQPIAKRTVVYVVQGGSLSIYNTATDAVQFSQITNLVGNFIDVKTVDF
jgi:hypothetical protein